MTADNMPWIMWNPDKVPTDNMPPPPDYPFDAEDIAILHAYARAYAEREIARTAGEHWAQLLKRATDAEREVNQLTAERDTLRIQLETATLTADRKKDGLKRATDAEQQTAEWKSMALAASAECAELRAQRDAARLANTHNHAAAEQQTAELRAALNELLTAEKLDDDDPRLIAARNVALKLSLPGQS